MLTSQRNQVVLKHQSPAFFSFFRNRQKSGVAAAVVDVVVVVAAAVVVAVVVAVADAADGEVTQKKPRKFEQHGSDFSSGKTEPGLKCRGFRFTPHFSSPFPFKRRVYSSLLTEAGALSNVRATQAAAGQASRPALGLPLRTRRGGRSCRG